jgi:uncharacterized protein
VKRALSGVLLALIGAYQRWISPGLPRRCKYYPTCSAYGAQAIRELGPLRGSVVAGWRLLRCNPFSDGGIDELADRSLFLDSPTRSVRQPRTESQQDPHGRRDPEVAS